MSKLKGVNRIRIKDLKDQNWYYSSEADNIFLVTTKATSRYDQPHIYDISYLVEWLNEEGTLVTDCLSRYEVATESFLGLELGEL